MSAEVAVLVGFLLFLGIVAWFQVPSMIARLLDARAARIRSDLEEARLAREEAQSLLAKFERDFGDPQREADEIVRRAKAEAEATHERAKVELRDSIDRKLRAAEERIRQAEATATRQVRDAAAGAAVLAAQQVLGEGMDDKRRAAMIDDGIETVADRLN